MTLPTVLVDMDGVLADFDAKFFALCRDAGWPMHCTLETQCHRFATDCMTDKEQARRAREIVNAPGWFVDLPVIDGAIEGFHELAEHAEVWICTKPLAANLECVGEKLSWVARHLGAAWTDRVITAPDKSMIRGDLLLDDAIKLDWLHRASWAPVRYPTPWNGIGSRWENLPAWRWGDPILDLLELIP